MRRNTTALIALIALMLGSLFFAACSSSDASTDDGHDDTAAAADDGHDDDADADHDEDADASHDDDADHDDEDLFAEEAHETLTLEMKDIAFAQTEITLEAGELVEIELSNTGVVAHDFTIAEIDAVHAVHGDHDPVAGHDEHGDELALHQALEAGDSIELRLRVHEAGTYEFYCTVPGHREAGMVGTLTVTE